MSEVCVKTLILLHEQLLQNPFQRTIVLYIRIPNYILMYIDMGFIITLNISHALPCRIFS